VEPAVLAEPDSTSFDLRFRLFGVDVRVHPLFWVMGAFISYGMYQRYGFVYLLAGVVCVFVSVLLHEFGHVLMGQVFGRRGHIVLHGFGGLAIGSSDVPRRWQRLLVLAAGPGIQLLLLLGVWVTQMLLVSQVKDGRLPPETYKQWFPVYKMLFWINLFWPLLNLLPIWPLDGGQMSREVCEGASPRNGTVIALTLSMALAGLLALNVLLLMLYESGGSNPNPLLAGYYDLVGRHLEPYVPADAFMGMFFAYFAVIGYQALQAEKQHRRRHDDYDEDLPWER
jgi:stage IV sporulation protein FB